MKVYVAVRGENCEGYGIMGVYKNRESAQKRCNEEEKKDNYLSCDFTDVQEWEIEE